MSDGIGTPVLRKEDLRLLPGAGRFGDDLKLDGQAYAVMVRSLYAHARIRDIDRAQAMSAGITPRSLSRGTHSAWMPVSRTMRP